MGMMIHRAMARANTKNAPKEPVKPKEEQVEEIVAEETKPVEEVRRGRPPRK